MIEGRTTSPAHHSGPMSATVHSSYFRFWVSFFVFLVNLFVCCVRVRYYARAVTLAAFSPLPKRVMDVR
jgi:hypothetical protein